MGDARLTAKQLASVLRSLDGVTSEADSIRQTLLRAMAARRRADTDEDQPHVPRRSTRTGGEKGPR